ncbi:NOL1/NOP2/sun family-domain-containing protein [Xylariaceae sp. FL1272]|nr:NOL1/NOP2/sun family-domain-containing protein [Xylariaceae sp. FL1272]
MGKGNRLKHQGVPEPLSDNHFTKLKRKAGLPVDDAPSKKKRTDAPTNGKANVKANGVKTSTLPPKSNGKAAPLKAKKSKKPEPELDSDDISDGIGGGFSDAEMDDDDLLDGEDGLGDDFLGSDDSVYDSDDAAPERRAMFSEDEDDDSDAEERLTAANIVGLSRKLDEEKAQEKAEAEAEMKETGMELNLDIPHVLDDEDEDGLQSKALLAPDLQLLRTRISDTVRVLDDFAKLSEPGRSRSEYTAQLIKDICAYYGYSEFLAEKLFNLFPPKEALAFFDANETARPVVIRTNTLKTSRRELASALIARGVTLEPVGKWSKVGLQIFESNVPLGATPEYLAGQYILQAASSFLPCLSLAPQPGERVLDMASAPGGKTTYLAAMMKNQGCIVANDPSKARSKGLIGNIHRLGVRNVMVCNYDAREFPRVMGGFDRVLLDAPCTGTGVVAKDASVKTNKTEKDFQTLPHTQKQLLLCAIDSVNHASSTGGFIAYSTCSVSIEENEMVVQYALKKRPNVKLVDTELPFGKEGFTSYQGKNFDKSLSLTRRFYPHTLNMDGFYVAKFQKIGPTPANLVKDKGAPSTKSDTEVFDKTPISADDKVPSHLVQDDDFGGFDDEEDEEYMERSKRNAMRKRGLDPKALNKPKAGSQKEEAKSVEETKSKEVPKLKAKKSKEDLGVESKKTESPKSKSKESKDDLKTTEEPKGRSKTKLAKRDKKSKA